MMFVRNTAVAVGVVMTVLLLWTQGAVAQFSSANLPPVYDLLFSQTRLEQVLDVYSESNSSHILIAAHRGGKEFDQIDGAPGNSIANIDNAVNKGFDLYESDIEILGDGSLVVFHDNNFDALTNTTVNDDLLDNATLAYAQTLFLTYDNGAVSSQRIPTLEAFLNAARGKIMVKFDLKSGTFGTSTLQEIFDIVVATKTLDQVLIRGGSHVLNVAASNGYDTRMIMRRFDEAPTVQEVNDLVTNYDIRAISIPNGADATVISAANAAGIIVEIHEPQGDSTMATEAAWQAAINSGVRQFHSFKPSQLMDFLRANNYRQF